MYPGLLLVLIKAFEGFYIFSGKSKRELRDVKMNNQNDMSASFQELVSSYGKMNTIVKNIESFSRQTEILAINSAIEAARAGKAGKGFAVISKEIKNLAAKSAKSNSESAEQLDIIKAKVNEVFAVRMADIAFDIIDKIDRNLFERHCDVKAWAGFDKVAAIVEENNDAIFRQATALLKNLVDIYEVYYDVFITNLDGTVLASGTKPQLVGKSFKDESWFKEISKTQKPTVNDMSYLDIFGGYAVGYNCPVKGKDGVAKGFLSTRFNWSFIYDIIQNAKVSNTGEILVINSRGIVIGSKNQDDVLKRDLSRMPAAQSAMKGQQYGYSIEAQLGTLTITGYAHTQGYNAYKGQHWSALAIETIEAQ
jgi:hypothetical protein